MNPPNATPYLSELIEQNALIRERNNLLERQNNIFEAMVRYQVPEIVFDGDDTLKILKGMYLTIKDLQRVLLPDQPRRDIPKGMTELEYAQLLCKRYDALMGQLWKTVANPSNYLCDNYGIIMVIQRCIKGIKSWKPEEWTTNRSNVNTNIISAWSEFTEKKLSTVLVNEQSWNL